MSSDGSSGIYLGTLDILRQLSPGTFTQRLLESVGLPLDGQVILNEIKYSPSGTTIAITLTDSCARNSATVAITAVSLSPLPLKAASPSESSKTSSPSTSPPSPPTNDGNEPSQTKWLEEEILRVLLVERGGSMDDEMIQALSARLSLLIRNAALPTSSMVPCSVCGRQRLPS